MSVQVNSETGLHIQHLNVFWCWLCATFAATQIIFVSLAIREGEAVTFFYGLFAMPFALFFTSPALLVWLLFLRGKGLSHYITSGAIFAAVLIGFMQFRHLAHGSLEDYFLFAIHILAGAIGGFVWHYFENLEIIR